MNKILIVKTSALGDIIHTYPVLEYLHSKFKHVQIDWVVEQQNAALVSAHPYVNEVFCIATKEWRKGYLKSMHLKAMSQFRQQLRQNIYDVAFDFQGNIKSGIILSQVRTQNKVGFACQSVPEWPNLLFTNKRYVLTKGANIREDYLSIAQSFVGDASAVEDNKLRLKMTESQSSLVQNILQLPLLHSARKVIVCPGSAWKNKQLAPETLQAFLSALQRYLKCNFLFLWGSDEEKSLALLLNRQFIECSHVVDRMSLPMVQNLMAECDLVIAMDSLPLHLAGTTSTPSFSVFGPSSAHKYKPVGASHYAFQGSCPYGRTFPKRCPILRTCSTGACIRHLSSHQLIHSFCTWWESLSG